jgi:hypothetical protein
LSSLGLTQLIACWPDEHLTIAVAFAGDTTRLRDLRATLRTRLERSPLLDGKRFVGNLEEAYLDLWASAAPEGGHLALASFLLPAADAMQGAEHRRKLRRAGR